MSDPSRSDEQVELASMVAQLLERRADPGAVRRAMASGRGHDEDLWRTLCEQVGVSALPVPEDAGGAGYGLAESFVVLEEVGRSLAPTPLLATLVATEALLAVRDEGGDDEGGDVDDLLSRIAAGEIATLADGAATGDPSTALEGDTAAIVLTERDGDLVLLDSPAATRVPALDPTLRLGRLDLAGAARRLGPAGEPRRRARLVGITGTALLGVGAMQRGLDMTVEHTRSREQFGRPIGSFQALKHRMADLLVQVEMARSAARAAAAAVSARGDDAERAAVVAGAYVGDAALRVAGEVIQLHGGIAITWEHDAHLVFKRAHAVGQLWGQPHQHRAGLA